MDGKIMKKIFITFFPFILLAQQERWVYRYTGNSDDRATSLVYGTDGNIYAAGFSGPNLMVISLTNTGDERWIYTYSGYYSASASSINYGTDGKIYVAGYIYDGEFSYGVVLCLNPNGTKVWEYISSQPSDFWSMVYGADGNIYVAGDLEGGGLFVVSLNSSGGIRWTYTYGSSGSANSIVYGADGNIYLTGYVFGSSTYEDIVVISLTTSGSVRWIYTYNNPSANSWDVGNSIIYGLDGNIYVTGRSHGNNTYADLVVISLNNTGSLNWIYRYDGPGHGWDWGNEIIYNIDNNLYVAGYSADPVSSYIVISLNPQGSERWIYRPVDGDLAFSICNDSYGNLYVTGRRRSSYDILTLRLSPSGNLEWYDIYNGPGNGYDDSREIVYGQDGNLYVCGFTTGNGTNYDFTVISYYTNPLGENDDSTGQDKKLSNTVCFPSVPTFFKDKIYLKFSNHSDYPLKITLYDILARKILIKNYSLTSSVVIDELQNLGKGIYFLEIYSKRKQIGRFKLIKEE